MTSPVVRSPTATPRHRSWLDRLPLLGAIAVAMMLIGGRMLVEENALPLAVRIGAAVLPAVVFVIWVASCVRAARRMSDELERRIQLEALAFAFPCAFALLMALGLIEVVVELPRDDLSYRHVWAMLPLFYIVGLLMARRRYA